MNKIDLENIDVEVSAENFAKIIEENNRTIFLNGDWGSGKTTFINSAKKYLSKNKKVITIELWNEQYESSVISLLTNSTFPKFRFLFIPILILLVILSLTITNIVDIGLKEVLIELIGSYYYIIAGIFLIVILPISASAFFKFGYDNIFYLYFKTQKKNLKDKIFIVDDFDRVSVTRQEEFFRFFNSYKSKTTFVFLGSQEKLFSSDSNYLAKVIDLQYELPRVLHPANIWNDYIEKISSSLDCKISTDLKNLFIDEKRNLRDRFLFNKYIEQEFFSKNKLGHVDVEQQIFLIYLYIFHKHLYLLLTNKKKMEKSDLESLIHVSKNQASTTLGNNKLSNSDIEILSFFLEIFKEEVSYPVGFLQNPDPYYINESPSNLSLNDAAIVLENNEILTEEIEKSKSINDDFSRYIIDLYTNGECNFPSGYSYLTQMAIDRVMANRYKLEKIAIDLFMERKKGFLIEFIIVESLTVDLGSQEFVLNYEERYLENYDLSQKMFFLTNFVIDNHNISKKNQTTYKQFYSKYYEEAQSIIEDSSKYEGLQNPPYLLNMLVFDEKRHWVGKDQWSDVIYSKISTLNDDDFIEFWNLFRILIIDYNLKEFTLYVGRFPGTPNELDRPNYYPYISFLIERLISIADTRKYRIYLASGSADKTPYKSQILLSLKKDYDSYMNLIKS